MTMLDTIGSILGKKRREIWFVTPQASVYEAIALMAEKSIGAVLVIADQRLVGIVSERDYARKVILKGRSSKETMVQEIMTRDLIIVSPENTVDECMRIMTDRRIRHLPVLDRGKLVGIVSIGDLVNAVIADQAQTIDQLHTSIGSAEAALRESEQQLRSLAGSLLSAQEDERRRISRELHDDLTQRLAGLAMELGTLAAEFPRVSQRLKKRLGALQRGVLEAAETSRHMAYQLHPAELDDLGLATAVRVYCEDFGRHGITVEFTSRNLPESVNREVASCLYRVAQESLRNIAKHANTRRASVTLEGKGDRILLQVLDNGVGFPVESLRAGGGLGVVSMQERVRHLNGSFAIQSGPEQGTVITVEVPLPKAETSSAGY
jgi:signal transduction histidine kinase